MPRRPLAYWLVPFVFALSLYAITIPGTYTYDDVYVAKDDERLHDTHRWADYLREGYFPGGADNLWRPLVSLSYAVEVKLHGDRPWVFHLIDVLLHAIATALVAVLAYHLAQFSLPHPSPPPEYQGRGQAAHHRVALLAGLLFAAHPVHVEAVAGIVGRAEEMALIGILAALILFIGKPMTTARAWGIVGWLLFAACSKEQGLLIPIMLLLWAFLHRRQPTDNAVPIPAATDQSPTPLDYAAHRPADKPALTPEQRATRTLVALLTLTMAGYIAYRNHILPWYWERGFLDPTFNPLVKTVGIDRWLIPFAVLGRYAGLLFAPVHLSLDYGMGVFTTKLDRHDPFFYLGILTLIVGAIVLIFLWWRRYTTALFIFICFALAYFMVSNVIMIGTIMGERLMYVPSAFFCILIAMLLAKLSSRLLVPITALILLLACLRTETYAYQWNTRPRLYRYSIDVQPKAAMPYLLLAGETDTATADALMAQARRVAPQSPQVWGKSAWVKIRLGQLDAAQDFAMHSFHLRSGNEDALGAMNRISELRSTTTRPASQPSR